MSRTLMIMAVATGSVYFGSGITRASACAEMMASLVIRRRIK